MKRKAQRKSEDVAAAARKLSYGLRTGDGAQLGKLREALTACLKQRQFVESPVEPAVYLQEHRFPAIHRSARDVAACPYPEHVRLVLLLRPVTFRTINRSVPDWAESFDGKLRVLCVDPVPGIFDALVAMLEWAQNETSSPAHTP